MKDEHSGAVHTRRWLDGKLVAEDFSLAEVSDHLADEHALVWVDMWEPGHGALLELAEELDLDPHAVEDALARSERTKAVRYATHIFLTVYATHWYTPVGGSNLLASRLRTTRVSVFVLPRGIVTVRRGTPMDIDEITGRWDENPELLRFGPGALVHGLLDAVVDGQFAIIEAFDDAVEDLEDCLFAERAHPRDVQQRIYRLRKELVQLRRVVLPMREIANAIMRHRMENDAPRELDSWYTDLYDHVTRAAEWTESLRDMVTTLFDTNLSLQDARLNVVMKKLTGWAAIIAVPTAITGWFGMNVPYPGFGTAAGALVSAVIIALSATVLYLAFRRWDWL